MRTLVLRLAAVVGLLLGVGCTDAVTLPNAGEGPADLVEVTPSQDAQAAYVCCDPIIIIVPRCDPYMQLDFSCEGDGGGDCASAAGEWENLAGCGAGGGGTGGIGGTGGTGKTGPSQPCPDYGCEPPPPCDPQVDPKCHRPLTSADIAVLTTAFAQYLRPLSSFQDPTAAAQCERLYSTYKTLFANGRVGRGLYTTSSGDPGIVPHTGAWDSNVGLMHIDPKYLDRAALGVPEYVRELVDTVLHESAHALGYQHPNDFVRTAWGPVYSDPFFNLLSPGANSCLVW